MAGLPVVIYDSVETVGYGQDSTVPELLLYGLLDQLVRLEVNGGRGLVQDQNLCLLEESSGQTQQLPLSYATTTDVLSVTQHYNIAVNVTINPRRPLPQAHPALPTVVLKLSRQ